MAAATHNERLPVNRIGMFFLAAAWIAGAIDSRPGHANAAIAPLPTQPASINSFDVTSFGAVGDGVTINTAAIQKGIDQCSAAGGGKLLFPAGRFLTGTIQIKSNVTLHLEEKAVLLGSTSAADYRNVDPFLAGDGVPLGDALIVAVDADHMGIEGAGLIDGQGKALAAARASTPSGHSSRDGSGAAMSP